MDKEYKGLEKNLERFKNDLTDEKMRLLFSIAYKQGYDQALSIANVVGRSEQLKALEDLKDFAYDNCQPHNSDRLAEIMERL